MPVLMPVIVVKDEGVLFMLCATPLFRRGVRKKKSSVTNQHYEHVPVIFGSAKTKSCFAQATAGETGGDKTRKKGMETDGKGRLWW